MSDAVEVGRRVEADGYCCFFSSVLKDYVAFYLTEEDRVKIPPQYVAYSSEELEKLDEAYDGTIPLRTMQMVHAAKKTGATVVEAE